MESRTADDGAWYQFDVNRFEPVPRIKEEAKFEESEQKQGDFICVLQLTAISWSLAWTSVSATFAHGYKK